jgi:predicted aspartyl protease
MIDRRQFIAGAAALAAAEGLGRGARAQDAEIPLVESGGRFLVDVRLNGGRPYRFVLDSGASTHFISSAIADSLGLPRVEYRNIQSFGGRTREPIVALRRLEVGGVEVADTRAVAWNAAAMEGHDGLVGYPIFGTRALLDLGAGRLALGAPRPPPDAVEVDAQVSDGETLLVGGPPGAEGRFVFDTGSARCVISRAYLARLRETDVYRQARQIIQVASDGRRRLVGLRLPELRFGALAVDNPFVLIADEAASPAMFHQVDALLGVELIRRCAWTLDRDARRLYASPPAAA